MRRDKVLLAFDTSAAHCAAALLAGGEIVTETYEEMARGQAERLMGLLEDMMAEADFSWRDLDAVAVGIGPGNFTGIRIAVSAARGLALGLGIPAIGVSTFEALRAGEAATTITSVDARQGRVYLQRHRPGSQADSPVLVDLDDLSHETSKLGFAGGAVCIGAAAERIARAFGGRREDPVYPLTSAIARTAAERLESGLPQPRPAPLYIRSPDAAPPRDPAPEILDG